MSLNVPTKALSSAFVAVARTGSVSLVAPPPTERSSTPSPAAAEVTFVKFTVVPLTTALYAATLLAEEKSTATGAQYVAKPAAETATSCVNSPVFLR